MKSYKKFIKEGINISNNQKNIILNDKSKTHIKNLKVKYTILTLNDKEVKWAIDWFENNGIKLPIDDLFIIKRSLIPDGNKVSQSSAKNHQFIELTTNKQLYDFDNDKNICAWLIHEIGHELFNRSNNIKTGLYNSDINDKFSKFLMGDKEFKDIIKSENISIIKDGKGLEYYDYPDSYANKNGVFSEEDAYFERIACYHQYKYLTDNNITFENSLSGLKKAYIDRFGIYKEIYFKKWFEFFKMK